MRLSTDAGRDDARSGAVLAAALNAGVDLVDTADAYCLDNAEFGHNERLIGATIADHAVTVVSKGGLTRPDGTWLPDGRARHLADAARASRDRLGVPAIDLYLLHAIDPRTPLATSVRALAKLRDDGVVRAIGVSNINLHQLEQALAITAIDAIEIELGPWRLDAIRGGLVAACERRGIRVLAHRPLGGAAGVRRLERDPIVCAIATRFGATPVEVALAWLCAQSPAIVPLPGATRIETARSIARAASLVLDPDALAQLGAHWLETGAPGESRDGEVVLVLGMPGAGKSTIAEAYVARGYTRLNRDERGGSLRDLARELGKTLATSNRVVLDNTYPTRASRAQVIAVARKHGVGVRCAIAATSLEDAQHNAVARVLSRHGRLLEPDELAREHEIGPGAQFRYRRTFEPPRVDEGFVTIDELPFARKARGGSIPALIVELDQLVWEGRPRTPGELVLRPGAAECLATWARAGYAIAATTWQPASIDPDLDRALAAALGVSIAIARCTHPAGPPVCWCRKPLPGLALWLAHAHDLALDRSVHLGRGPADRGFAARANLRYVDAAGDWPTP